MFDLEQSIVKWRQQMLAAGVKAPVPLEELEIHLYEEIERQVDLGQSEADAFNFAVQKIGPANTVRSEFKIIEETEEERKRKEGLIWSGGILGLLQLIVIGAVLFNSDMTFGQRMAGLAAIMTSLLLVCGIGLNYQLFPVIRDRRVRTVVSFTSGIVPAAIWFLIFAHFYLTGHEYPFGQYLVALLWGSCPPLAAGLGLIWGFETMSRKAVAPATA